MKIYINLNNTQLLDDDAVREHGYYYINTDNVTNPDFNGIYNFLKENKHTHLITRSTNATLPIEKYVNFCKYVNAHTVMTPYYKDDGCKNKTAAIEFCNKYMYDLPINTQYCIQITGRDKGDILLSTTELLDYLDESKFCFVISDLCYKYWHARETFYRHLTLEKNFRNFQFITVGHDEKQPVYLWKSENFQHIIVNIESGTELNNLKKYYKDYIDTQNKL